CTGVAQRQSGAMFSAVNYSGRGFLSVEVSITQSRRTATFSSSGIALNPADSINPSIFPPVLSVNLSPSPRSSSFDLVVFTFGPHLYEYICHVVCNHHRSKPHCGFITISRSIWDLMPTFMASGNGLAWLPCPQET